MNPELCETGCGPVSKLAAAQRLPNVKSLILLAPRLLFATLGSGAGVIRNTLDGSYDQYDATHCGVCQDYHSGACCAIPETACPSPCHIRWSGCVGDSFKYQLQITNRSKVEREFTLTPEAFPVTGEKVSVSPDKKTLAPDKSFTAVVSFTIPDTMAGGCFQSQILLAGAYQEPILVSLEVKARQCCQSHIEQGEMPKKVQTHHWFRHFQFEQDCFPEVGDKP